MSLFADLKDIKIKDKNCEAIHIDCQKKNVFYSILNGYFVYYCLTCKKWINKSDLK